MGHTEAVANGKKDACKTFIEQTKLLVTLASAFLVAPAVLLGRGNEALGRELAIFLLAEVCFVLSVLLGYVVLGSIAGSQHSGKYNVYRKATRRLSMGQFTAYVLGMSAFVVLVVVRLGS